MKSQEEVKAMLVAALLFVVGIVMFLVYYGYVRSWKGTQVLLFDKGNVSSNSRFLVCSKCGRAQARNGGYQECCRTRL